MSIELTVENVYLRQDAVKLTRKHFGRLMMMLLVILLFTWLLDAGLTVLGDAITSPQTNAVVSAITTYSTSPNLTSYDPVADAMTALLTSPKYLLFNLFYIVITSLVTNGLSLGRHAQLLAAAARNEKPKVLGGFSRMRCCFKAWRLAIWVAIKTLLWAMPGGICIIIGTVLQTYGLPALGNIMSMAGVGLLFALTIRAGLSYCMATFILADEPDRGVRECVTFSRRLMRSRLWQAFKLGVPMLLKMIGVMYGSMLVLSVPVAVLAASGEPPMAVIVILLILLVIALPAIYFSLQFDLVYALFYLQRRKPADASTSCWLRDHADTPAALPEESPAVSPEDTFPENTEEKENRNEEPVC